MTEDVSNMSPEELQAALQHYRDHCFSRLLVISIELAAQSHPEELRKALGRVLDLEVYEEQAKRLLAIVTNVQQRAADVRAVLGRLEDQMRTLEKRQAYLNDAARFNAEQASRNGK